jgi:hypothetical protein
MVHVENVIVSHTFGPHGIFSQTKEAVDIVLNLVFDHDFEGREDGGSTKNQLLKQTLPYRASFHTSPLFP